jgi:hypothetical protein
MSFDLREIVSGGPTTQRFVFDEELKDDVFQAFVDDNRVRVAGRSFPVRNVNYALAISPVADETAVTQRIESDEKDG